MMGTICTRLTIVVLCFSGFFTGLMAQNSATGDQPLQIGASFRIYPSNTNQTEVFIAQSPADPDILWVSCNTLNFIPFFISEGIYTTVNGGNTWQGNDTCTGDLLAFHGGDPGITIDKDGTFILTRLGRSPFKGLYSHFSTNQGETWSYQKVISTDDLERAAITSNSIPGSPGYGRTYAAWIKFAMPYPMMVASTDDHAQSWTAPRQLNNPSSRSAGGDVAIGPNGEVYVCWAGVTDTSPFKEILTGFARSTNGGESWSINENAFPVNGITGVLPQKGNIRVNGLPSISVDLTNGPRKGWIYIVTGEKNLAPAGTDPDIILHRSEDGGLTWSQGIRVNQDAPNNGKIQYFPTVHVDKKGAVNVIFYDDRHTTSDSAGVFLARSTDGGITFKEFEICDHHFKPQPIGGLGQGYQGDNIDITSTDTHLWPVWMDNSTGIYQVWAVKIDYSSLEGIGIPGNQSARDRILFNDPNPFQFETTFKYQLTSKGPVLLQVYDIQGNKIAEPVNAIQQPGKYQKTFTIAELPGLRKTGNGLLFYRFTTPEKVETGKMILLK